MAKVVADGVEVDEEKRRGDVEVDVDKEILLHAVAEGAVLMGVDAKPAGGVMRPERAIARAVQARPALQRRAPPRSMVVGVLKCRYTIIDGMCLKAGLVEKNQTRFWSLVWK